MSQYFPILVKFGKHMMEHRYLKTNPIYRVIYLIKMTGLLLLKIKFKFDCLEHNSPDPSQSLDPLCHWILPLETKPLCIECGPSNSIASQHHWFKLHIRISRNSCLLWILFRESCLVLTAKSNSSFRIECSDCRCPSRTCTQTESSCTRLERSKMKQLQINYRFVAQVVRSSCCK